MATAIPAHRPPPPTGTTTCARSGTSSSSSRPSVPWPATIAGSSKGCTNASPPVSARSCAATRHSWTELPPMWTVVPWPRAASTFAIGASDGTNTSHGTPRMRAAAARAWAWLPAEAATTPRAQPSSPSAASLAATPRTLNDPVRCRFSALSTTVPPARSENVRVDRIGVRLATVPTACRTARTSASVTVAVAGISRSRGWHPSPPRRPSAARRRRSSCARAGRTGSSSAYASFISLNCEMSTQ